MIPIENSHELAGSPLYPIKNGDILKKLSLKILPSSRFCWYFTPHTDLKKSRGIGTVCMVSVYKQPDGS